MGLIIDFTWGGIVSIPVVDLMVTRIGPKWSTSNSNDSSGHHKINLSGQEFF